MNSEQLSLRLDWSGVPWEGRSPRVLPRGYNSLFLRREPQKDARQIIDPKQIDMFNAGSTGPRKSSGAPSLLPLPRGGGYVR